MKEELNLVQEWDKVFPQSDKVNHKKVTFKNHFGITLVADMYEPKDYEDKLPALAVSGPYGAVKEQSSGLYAEEMAEKGFLTITFDPSLTGESGGTYTDLYDQKDKIPFDKIEKFLKENLNNEKNIINCNWLFITIYRL